MNPVLLKPNIRERKPRTKHKYKTVGTIHPIVVGH
jgi:hypothetical protein